MKHFKFDPYSPYISGVLFLLSLPSLDPSPMALFLFAFVFSFLIKRALIPTGKKYIPFLSSEKVAYEHQGKLHVYRSKLVFFYWLCLAMGTVLLVQAVCG